MTTNPKICPKQARRSFDWPIPEQALARFWDKVSVQGENECWPWKGATDGRYGQFWLSGATQKATRVSWSIANGRACPLDSLICHRCDNPVCVNPRHLFLGTMSDNIVDAVKKGRYGRSKFTAEQINEVRRLSAEGVKCSDLARRFGMERSYVYKVIRRRTWRHLPRIDAHLADQVQS